MGEVPTQAERGAPGSQSRAVIELDGVSKRFGSLCAVQDASFEILAGEFFSMLGPSGCGKTTTLRMIAGFESPSAGRILLDGKDVSRTPPYRRHVNTVFQQYALFPHMNVTENVAFGLRAAKVPKGEIAERVRRILEVVHMEGFAGRRPAQLSGGQQQRVALARALVNEPSALLLDEPLAALDLKLRQAMQLELKRIQRDLGATFVFVTHDQQEALTMSDRIAVMADGWVEQIGTPAEIYHRPATAFVAGFIGEANLLAAEPAGTGAARVAGAVIGLDEPVHPGSLLMVRPEQVRIQNEPPNGAATGLEATINEVVFRGPSVRVGLESPDGTALVANLVAGPGLDGLRPGERVWACWDRQAGYLVRAGRPGGTPAGAQPPPNDRTEPDSELYHNEITGAQT